MTETKRVMRLHLYVDGKPVGFVPHAEEVDVLFALKKNSMVTIRNVPIMDSFSCSLSDKVEVKLMIEEEEIASYETVIHTFSMSTVSGYTFLTDCVLIVLQNLPKKKVFTHANIQKEA